ncbi:MAG TPA: ABC transporter ATP-binding protein, partial [Gammaproteobacteria bacterium]|nr:ABC transporter ATP-binding protein [Gammaproteobacteria bacterium]
MGEATPLLEVRDLSVTFASEAGPVRAVRSLSYAVNRGEVLGIVGESGSGKTVSSLAVMDLLPRHARVTGSVRFAGQELVGMPDRQLSQLRGRRIAMIFQDPLSALTPVYTVGDQIAEAIRVHRDVSAAAAHDRAVELLQLVGIPNAARRAASFPHEFSGGMRQRVMIAMAIANDPALIIADEPTTALDVTVQAQILDLLQKAREVTGAAVLLITHDLGVVAGLADRVGVMYAGKLVETGPVDAVFHRPRMPYTLGLLGSLPRPDLAAHQPLTPIEGQPPSLVQLPPGCPFAPRCPLRIERCTEVEPELAQSAAGTAAACHRSDEVERRRAEGVDVFPAAHVPPAEAAAGGEQLTVLAVRDL